MQVCLCLVCLNRLFTFLNSLFHQASNGQLTTYLLQGTKCINYSQKKSKIINFTCKDNSYSVQFNTAGAGIYTVELRGECFERDIFYCDLMIDFVRL